MRGARLALASGLTLLTLALWAFLGILLWFRCASASSSLSLDALLTGPNTIVEVSAIELGEVRNDYCGAPYQDAVATIERIRWRAPWKVKHDHLDAGGRVQLWGAPEEWRDVRFGTAGEGPVFLGLGRNAAETHLHWGLVRAAGGWLLAGAPYLTQELDAFRRWRGGPLDTDELVIAWTEEELSAWREADGDEVHYRPGPIQADWIRFYDESLEPPDPWYDRPPSERLVEDAPAHVKDGLLRFRLSLVIPEVSSVVPRWRDLDDVTFCLRSRAGLSSCNTLQKDPGLRLVQMQGFAVPGEDPVLMAGRRFGDVGVVVGRIPISEIRDGGNVRVDLSPVAPRSLFELVAHRDRFGLPPHRFRAWTEEEYRRVLTETVYVGRG